MRIEEICGYMIGTSLLGEEVVNRPLTPEEEEYIAENLDCCDGCGCWAYQGDLEYCDSSLIEGDYCWRCVEHLEKEEEDYGL